MEHGLDRRGLVEIEVGRPRRRTSERPAAPSGRKLTGSPSPGSGAQPAGRASAGQTWNQAGQSARRGSTLSLSERTTSSAETDQSMPISGSFQITPRSAALS